MSVCKTNSCFDKVQDRKEKQERKICNARCDTVGKELTIFGMLVHVLRLFLQNVAVSKSRHRLLFYPTRKEKSTEKFLFRDISEYGG